MFRKGVKIPYLFTTGPLTQPNILLVFATPQRVPALRRAVDMAPNVSLPFTARMTRSAQGVFLDGVTLRAEGEEPVVRGRLIAAGLTPVEDITAWLVAHRETTSDPALIREEVKSVRRRRIWSRFVRVVPFAGALAFRFLPDGVGAAIVVVLLVTAFAGPRVLKK